MSKKRDDFLKDLDFGIVGGEFREKGIDGDDSVTDATGKNKKRALSGEKPMPQTYRVPPSLHKELKQVSKDKGVQIGQLVTFLLKKGLANHLDDMRIEPVDVVIKHKIIMD